MDVQTVHTNLKNFIIECKRVFKLTRKPTNDEYKTIVKASGLGILIIGGLGFIISMINQLFF